MYIYTQTNTYDASLALSLSLSLSLSHSTQGFAAVYVLLLVWTGVVGIRTPGGGLGVQG